MKDDVLDYLAMHSDYYKDLLKNEIEQLKTYLMNEYFKLFWDDIRQQFENKARYIIAEDLVSKFDMSVTDAYILIEDACIKEYLK